MMKLRHGFCQFEEKTCFGLQAVPRPPSQALGDDAACDEQHSQGAAQTEKACLAKSPTLLAPICSLSAALVSDFQSGHNEGH